MLFTVYRTRNLANGKVYVGTHRTDDPNDAYLGSGVALKRAVLKYGTECFEKEIVGIFHTAHEMFALEREIVDEAFVSRKDTYNLKIGGDGGFDFINTNNLRATPERLNECRLIKLDTDPEFRSKWSEHCRSVGLENKRLKLGIHGASDEQRADWNAAAQERALLPEARQKRIDSFARIGHQQGDKNSQHGTCWIKHVELGKTQKIPVSDLDTWASQGWVRGRILERRRGRAV